MLIQPILAYGDGVPEYQIFTGFYDWHDGQWQQSAVLGVRPGAVVRGSVWWEPASRTYKQSIASDGARPVTTTVTLKQTHGEVFTDVYFVVEHQPNACSEYPADGAITFADIEVAWESGAPLTPASWAVETFKPACASAGAVLNATALKFTWDVAGSV